MGGRFETHEGLVARVRPGVGVPAMRQGGGGGLGGLGGSIEDLFDHLVGAGEQAIRHGESECLGGLKIDD